MRPSLPDRVFTQPWRILALFFVAVLAGWRGFDLLLALCTGRPLHFPFTVNLRTTQYFFAYQTLGFVKRGLIGTLIHPFPALTTRVGIGLLYWFFLVVFTLQFWRFLLDSTRSIATCGRGTLALLGAAMPAFLPRLGYDFGRFDVIDLIAALAAIGCLRRSRVWLASALGALAILAHEDFLLFSLPLLLALASGWRLRLRLLALPLAAYFALSLWGGPGTDSDHLIARFGHDSAYLAAVPDGQVQENEVAVLSRSLRDNFALDRQMFVAKRATLHLTIIALWFSFAVGYVVRFYRGNALALDGPFVAAFAPLLLGVVGFDYYRWFAMAAVNLMLVVLLQCRRLADQGAVPRVYWDLSAKVLTASIILGPISNTKSFLYPFLFLDRVLAHPFPW